MDKECKLSLCLLFILTVVPLFLLYFLAGIPPFSKEFIRGFFPFLFLLIPYILFSSSQIIALLQKWALSSFWKKLLVPLYITTIYLIFQPDYSTFQWENFFGLFAWLFIPSFIFLLFPHHPLKIWAVVLLLWLPVETRFVRGFDIIFTENIQIPAIPFAATVFGIYLFLMLGNLEGIGYTFLWRWKDILTAGISLLILALILIPLGSKSGFVHYSFLEPSVADIFKLILGIYFFVALPEELLFRGIIQNLLSKALKTTMPQYISLIGASVIFGLAHWNNLTPPDWRYVFLSIIGGLFYGFTYVKTGKSTVSAIVHCGVNFIWAIFFKDSPG